MGWKGKLVNYIIRIKDGSSRYDYNVWTTFEGDSGILSEDARIFHSDSLEEFNVFMAELAANSDTPERAKAFIDGVVASWNKDLPQG